MGWLLDEFKRAKERQSKIPPGARPVVTTGRTLTRAEDLAARRTT